VMRSSFSAKTAHMSSPAQEMEDSHSPAMELEPPSLKITLPGWPWFKDMQLLVDASKTALKPCFNVVKIINYP
jgi:hypothetical protein